MSGAEFWEFQHNDLDSLAELLAKAGHGRTLVVVDAVFSMDGDIIDLPGVVDLCKKFGALLMVDEAHSLGVLGQTGAAFKSTSIWIPATSTSRWARCRRRSRAVAVSLPVRKN